MTQRRKATVGDPETPDGAAAVSAANWPVLAAVGTGTFMSALDSSIVNTVLPVLTRALNTNVASIEWVVTIYLLMVSGLLLGMGRLGDLRGHKRTYTAGFGVFIVASGLCAMATTVQMLIAFRALQALGAAALFAMSPAILTAHFPPSRRGQALGLQAMMTYLGLTVGPPLGGWLATHWSWHAIFTMNIPVGLLALFLSARFIPDDPPAKSRQPFDVRGAAVFMVGLVSLLTALNQGHAWGWGSVPVLGLFTLAALALAWFVSWELRVPHPMLDFRLFGSRTFSGATLSALLNYVSVYSIVFVLPFYLIRGRGLNPAEAGLILTAQPLVMAVSAPLSGSFSDRIGTRPPAIVGMAVLALGLFLLARLGPHTEMWKVAAALATAGLGTGVFISPNNSALMGAAPRTRQGVAAGVLATARNVGMVLGIGITGAIFLSVTEGRVSLDGSPALFAAVRACFLAASAVAALGAATSALHGLRPSANGSEEAPPPSADPSPRRRAS